MQQHQTAMSYEVKVVTQHDPRAKAGSNRYLRRLPPVLQIASPIDPTIENKFQELSWRAHRSGQDLKVTCQALKAAATALGYRVKIGVQEVYVENMPSYPGETVMSALILMDVLVSEPQAKGQNGPSSNRWRETG